MSNTRFLLLFCGLGLAVLVAMVVDDWLSPSSDKPSELVRMQQALRAHWQLRVADLPEHLRPPVEWLVGPNKQGTAAAEDEFDVILAALGDSKIQVIREVRGITGLGLKAAKDLVEGAPKVVRKGATKQEAEEITKKLEGAGATVSVRPSPSSDKPLEVVRLEKALRAHRQTRFADLPESLQPAVEWLAGRHKECTSEAAFAYFQSHPTELRALSQILGTSQGDYARKLAAFSLGYLNDVTLEDFNAIVDSEKRHIATGGELERYFAQSTIEDLITSSARLLVRDSKSEIGRQFLVQIVEDVVENRHHWNTSYHAMAILMQLDAEAFLPLYERWAAHMSEVQHRIDPLWSEEVAESWTVQFFDFVKRSDVAAADHKLASDEIELLDDLLGTVSTIDIDALRQARERRENLPRSTQDPAPSEGAPEPRVVPDSKTRKARLDLVTEPDVATTYDLKTKSATTPAASQTPF